MKLVDIIKVIAKELGTSDVNEINKLLKKKPAVKFRIIGKNLKNLGFTGLIKSISEEGIKAFMTNKVSLIRLDEIEKFEKSTPSQWYTKPAQAKPTAGPVKKPTKLAQVDDEDDEDMDDEDDNFHDLVPVKAKKSKVRAPGKQGSKFIPVPKKR